MCFIGHFCGIVYFHPCPGFPFYIPAVHSDQLWSAGNWSVKHRLDTVNETPGTLALSSLLLSIDAGDPRALLAPCMHAYLPFPEYIRWPKLPRRDGWLYKRWALLHFRPFRPLTVSCPLPYVSSVHRQGRPYACSRCSAEQGRKLYGAAIFDPKNSAAINFPV